MCKQLYFACKNLSCDGFAQVLEFFPCENKPYCEIEYIRMVRPRSTEQAFCPDCRVMTKQQRKKQMSRIYVARRRAKAKSMMAQQGKSSCADDNGDARVEKEGESSTMAESRGAVDDGLPLYSDRPFSTLEETGPFDPFDPFFLQEEQTLFGSNAATGDMHEIDCTRDQRPQSTTPPTNYGAMTQQQQINHSSNHAYMVSKAESNSADENGHMGVEQSSTMTESGGAVGDGFLPYSDGLFSTWGEIERSDETDPFFLQEEQRLLRSNLANERVRRSG